MVTQNRYSSFLRLLCTVFFAVASIAPAAEVIHHFNSTIEVLPNSDLVVTEAITVSAEGNAIKHGIFRDLPTLYKSKFGLLQKVDFEVLSVLRNKKEEPFVVESLPRGKRIKIGSPDRRVPSGKHTYTISYRISRQLGQHEEDGKKWDELYWNVTGNGWRFPIKKVTATVVLPKDVAPLSYEAYTGEKGAQGQDYDARKTDSNQVIFTTTERLSAKEGISIVTTWEPGYIDHKKKQSLIEIFRDNLLLLLSLAALALVFFYHLTAWFLFGRDPAPGTIIPRYEPPTGFSAAACRFLREMGFDDKVFSSAIIELATLGTLHIRNDSKKDFTLESTGDPETLIKDPYLSAEKALHQKLLGSKSELDLKQKNHKTIRKGRVVLEEYLGKKLKGIHFNRNLGRWVPGLLLSLIPIILAILGAREKEPAIFMSIWLAFWTFGTSALLSKAITEARGGSYGPLLFAGIFSIGWFVGAGMLTTILGILPVTLFVIAAIINLVFFHLIKAPTKLGRDTLDEIEGFRRYLSVAEEDRLNLQNPPHRTPELFEKFLPYALALDCDQEWSQQFSNVLDSASTSTSSGRSRGYHPTFYSGTNYGALGTAALGSALGAGLASTLASSSSSPRSSGSGGGGSSGGGGGGGGGGGW